MPIEQDRYCGNADAHDAVFMISGSFDFVPSSRYNQRPFAPFLSDHTLMHTRWIPLAIAIFALPALAHAQEAPHFHELDAEEAADLMDGGVERELVRGDVLRAEVIGLIQAPVAELAEIVTDFANMTEWAPATERYNVLEDNGDHYIIDGETRLPWPIANRTWNMRTEYSYQDVDGHEAFVYTYQYIPGSGNLNDSFGYYLMLPWPDDPSWTYVRYVVNADPGVALPDAVIRWATRNALPDIIGNMRERHEELY